MSLWGSLYSGVASVANFVVSNAPSIVNAVTTIGSLLSPNQVIIKSPKDNVLPDLVNYLEKNQEELHAIANADEDFKPPQTKGSDINKFLTLNDVPTTLGAKNAAIDVGQTIAQQIFDGSPGKQKKTAENPKIFKELFSIDSEDHKITGGQVSYKVPLGNNDLDQGWHSVLRVWDTPSALRRQGQKTTAAPKPRRDLSIEGPYNSTTLAVTWTVTKTVPETMSRAIDRLLDDYGNRIELEATSQTGDDYVYQFYSKTDIGPGEVQSALLKAINRELSESGGLLTQLPQVNITQKATHVGQSSKKTT